MNMLPTRIPDVFVGRVQAGRRNDDGRNATQRLRVTCPRILNGTRDSERMQEFRLGYIETIQATAGFTAQPSYCRSTNSHRLLSCTGGEICGVTLDLRMNSPAFLEWQAFYFRRGDARSLFVGPGIALGWQMVSPSAEVQLAYHHSPADLRWKWLFWDELPIDDAWPLAPTGFAEQTSPSRRLGGISKAALPRFSKVEPESRPEVCSGSRADTRSQHPAGAASQRRRRKSNRFLGPVKRRRLNSIDEVRPGHTSARSRPTLQRIHQPPSPRESGQPSGPILLIGSSSALGRGLLKPLTQLGTVIGACEHPDRGLLPVPIQVDMTRPASLREAVRTVRPSLIVNTAFVNDPESAEANPRQAQLVNAHAPAVLAEEATKIGAGIVHFCSDMVFGGEGERPHREGDRPKPINQLARTRLLGTQAILDSEARSIVFRTGWLYSVNGDNYIKRIVELSSYRDTLTLAEDHYGCPTSIEWLGERVHELLAQAAGNYPEWLEQHGGLYHASLLGFANRVAVADQVVASCKRHGIPLTVTSIRGASLADFAGQANIPPNCRLDPAKFATTFGFQLPRWQEELHKRLSQMLGHRIPALDVA